MRVLIHERYGSGHRMMAVRLLLDALLEVDAERQRVHGDAVPALHIAFSTRSDTPLTPQYREHIAPLADRFELVSLTDGEIGGERRSALDNARTNLRDLDRLLGKGAVDRLYMPYADNLLQLAALRTLVPFAPRWPKRLHSEAVVMRTRFAYPDGIDAKAAVGRLALARAPFSTLHLIDAAAHRHVLEHHRALAERVQLMPDPVNRTRVRSRDAARDALGLPRAGRLIGIIGQIDERKGIDLLVAAFRRMAPGPQDRLLIAGPQVDSVRRYLATVPQDGLIMLDRYLDENALGDTLSAIDVFAAPYRNHTGSASMVVRAAAAGRPTVAVDTGWFAYIVPRFELGEVCDVTDAGVFAAALTRVLEHSAEFTPGPEAQAMVRYGSRENIIAHWSEGIRRALSLPRHPGYRAWPDGGTTRD